MALFKKDYILLIITLLLVLGIYFGFTSPVICLSVIFLILINTTKHTAGFFLLMYGGVLGGTTRSLFPFIPIYGIILNIIGIFLVGNLLKKELPINKKSLIYLFVTFFLFLIYYLLGPRSDYSTTKIINIVQFGIMFFIAYFVLDKSEDIRIKDMSILLMLTSVFLISYAVKQYGLYPTSFLDFNWLRQGLMNYAWFTKEDLLIDYQEVGMDATYAATLVYSLKKQPKGTYLYIALAFYLTLVSGARQSLAAFVAVFFCRNMFYTNVKNVKKFLVYTFMLILMYVVYTLLKSSNITAVAETLEDGDEIRTLIWLTAIKVFLDNPIVGVGLGGYALNPLGDKYPHNFFLEVLAELGIVGFISLLLLVVSYLKFQKIKFNHCTRSEMFYFLSLLALFIRIMVSADFSLSISVFCAIYATTNYKKIDYKS